TLAAIERGFIQEQIHEAAYAAQQKIDRGEAVVVGVNRYRDEHADTGAGIQVFQVDPAIERQQIERLRQVRASRSRREWEDALAAVERTAREGGNMVPPILAAVEARATL